MHTWYTKQLGDGMILVISSAEIKESFLQSFHEKGEPLDMAVFTRLEPEGSLHCKVMAYFSPAAEDIAKIFEAQPCRKPSRAGLDLLAGDERSWSYLFPEQT